MASFSRTLEQTLHRALSLAGAKKHEFATLEHLLFALTEDQDAIAVLRACNVDVEKLRQRVGTFIDEELRGLVVSIPQDAKPTLSFQRSVVRPRGSDRRQCAGCDFLRTREPCRAFPAGAGHDPAGCRQLYQPWRGQGAG